MNCLILGAGLMQKPAITASKKMGYNTVVIDGDQNAVCVPLADEFYKIDLKAREEILELAKQLQEKGGLKAVFTAGTDFSASVSYVCEKLGLPAHSFEAAVNASVKTQMRECFEKAGVPSPKFQRVDKSELSSPLDLLESILEKMTFPLVVKPVDNMGARGCRMVRSQIEFLPAIQSAVDASRSGNAIVEEYMEGPEYSIDALIYNGTMTITGFAERHIYYPPYFIEMGHTMPAILEKSVHDQLISVFALGAASLGLTCGAAKADIKFTKNGPMIGEIAGRLSGGYMSGWTYPYASDLNLTQQALLIASGENPVELIEKRQPVEYTPSEICKNHKKPYELFEIPCVRTSAERAWISIPGTVQYVEDITEYTDKAVFNVLPRATVEVGSSVDFPRNNVQKCGNVISVSKNHQIAMDASEAAVSNIFITLTPDNIQTEKFLNNCSQVDEESFPPSAYGSIQDSHLSAISGVLPKNASLEKSLPEIIKNNYGDIRDWNYNTISDTAKKFDILRSVHPEIDMKTLIKAIFRGGIQAAVYVSDTIASHLQKA
ncbi:MAG: ATP-grasp domain-containing protein [Treponema sp.]|nr:ATP-grasp domain-containing protein [Treponema sp.]